MSSSNSKMVRKKEISYSHLVFLSSKEEVDIDEAISHSPEKKQGELLNIVRDSEVVKPCMFGKVMYMSVLFCLCCVKDIPTDMSEEQVEEERDLDLNDE